MKTEPTSGNRDLIVLLARRRPELSVYVICDKVAELHRLAMRWQRATVHLCNGTKDQAWYDNERTAVRVASVNTLDGTRLTVNLMGDPRGCTLRLVPADKRVNFSNSAFAGDGWGVV